MVRPKEVIYITIRETNKIVAIIGVSEEDCTRFAYKHYPDEPIMPQIQVYKHLNDPAILKYTTQYLLEKNRGIL